MRRNAFGPLLYFFAIALAPQIASAQQPRVQAAAFAGSGLSVGMGSAASVLRRSPTSIVVQVMGSNSERSWLRYGGSLRAEVEGKVTFGVVPQVSIHRSFGDRLSLGGIGGIPIIVAPRSLYGVEVGVFLDVRILDWLAAVAQVMLDFFFLGNDLPQDSFLFMMQAHVGVEFRF